MSHRQEQLESSLQRAIGLLLSEGLNDPRVRGLVSVTAVKVSPDTRHANVAVSVFPAEQGALAVHGLQAASGHIRSSLGGKLQVRSVPLLHFELDQSLKKQAAVLSAIGLAARDTKPPSPAADEPAPDDTNRKGVEP